MKKILFLLAGFSCSAFALEQNPIAPPSVEIVDKYGVNLQSGMLARKLSTVSIGGELGLNHSVELYTDLFADGNFFGFVDAFAGSVMPKNISENQIEVVSNIIGDPLYFHDLDAKEYTATKRISVMRAYGPAGSQDFLVYQNGVLNRDASATSGRTFKAVGDSRHTLVESADKTSLIWTTPDGTESKYSNSPYTGRSLEITYPNGFKVRVAYRAVTTNTGFMLKYQLNGRLNGTPDQIVALNLANQYCSADAATCSNTGWPTATFTWPIGTPSNFWTPDLPSSNYLVKLATPAGLTEIQYQPENMCITNLGYEDTYCRDHTSGLAKWSSRLRSIKTPESAIPNYQYTYQNTGAIITLVNGGSSGGYWFNSGRVGQVVTATVNGNDQESYSGPGDVRGALTRHGIKNGVNDIEVQASQYDVNVINFVITKKGGKYDYYKDLRHFIEFHEPITGGGPKKHYYYNGPGGNLSQIYAVTPSGEIRLQEATYGGYVNGKCKNPKTCNKPTKVTDALGNETEYDYDPDGRFGSPIKITGPAAKTGGVRPATVYNYVAMYASYKRTGETITQDTDPVWLLSNEHTCISTAITSTGCVGGDVDTIRTNYYYGPKSAGLPNNLLLRGKSVTADGVPSVRVTCYEYDKTGKLIGETKPKGNSTDLQSCP